MGFGYHGNASAFCARKPKIPWMIQTASRDLSPSHRHMACKSVISLVVLYYLDITVKREKAEQTTQKHLRFFMCFYFLHVLEGIDFENHVLKIIFVCIISSCRKRKRVNAVESIFTFSYERIVLESNFRNRVRAIIAPF